MSLLIAMLLGLLAGPPADPSVDPAGAIETRIGRIDGLLHEWRIVEARTLAEALLQEHPDLPAVQFAAGWVKFHLGDHAAAAALVDRAAAAFGDRRERDPRLGMVRAMARRTRGFVRALGPGGRVVIWHAPGVDEVLVPDLIDAIERTLRVVGEDLGHQPDHPILVQVLADSEALADATGLTEEEIRTSGTIAVCKFGRLMLTSPRATLKGYSYLDTVSHELIHLLISEKTRNLTPIWLHEALAKYEDTRWRSDEPLYRAGLAPMRQSNLARALERGELITFEQMHPSMALLPSQAAADLAFSEVYTVTAFLLERKGYPGIRELLERLARGVGDLAAIEQVYGLDEKGFVKAWLAWLGRQDLLRLDGAEGLDRREQQPGQAAGERALTRARRVDLRDLFHLGQLLRARAKLKAAAVEYRKAHRLAGARHAGRWVIGDKLGQVLAALGRPEEAIELFGQSLQIHPDNLDAHLHLGRLLAERDAWQAFLHLRQASRLNPIDPRIHRALADVCHGLAEAKDPRENFAALAERHKLATRLVQLLRPGRSGEAIGEPDQAQAMGESDLAGTGLRIVTRPWARVWLDFVDTGLTTPVFHLSVAPGHYVLGLAADCLEVPAAVWVRVEPGQTVLIDRELCPEPASAAPLLAR